MSWRATAVLLALLLMPLTFVSAVSSRERGIARVVGAYFKQLGYPSLVDGRNRAVTEIEVFAIKDLAKKKDFDVGATESFLKNCKLEATWAFELPLDSKAYFGREGFSSLSNWKKFYKSFPACHGYIRLSGLSKESVCSDRLVTFAYLQTDGGCGASYLLELRSGKDGHWQVMKDTLIGQYEHAPPR